MISYGSIANFVGTIAAKTVVKRKEISLKPHSTLKARYHEVRFACSVTVSSSCAPTSFPTRQHSKRNKSRRRR